MAAVKTLARAEPQLAPRGRKRGGARSYGYQARGLGSRRSRAAAAGPCALPVAQTQTSLRGLEPASAADVRGHHRPLVGLGPVLQDPSLFAARASRHLLPHLGRLPDAL